MAKLGRPPKLDENKRGQILGILGVGGSMATAAAAVGCCVRTIYNTGERDREFFQAMRAARAMEEVRLLKRIDDASEQPRHWRAAAWKLERLHPGRYRPKPHDVVTPADLKEFVEQIHEIIDRETDHATSVRIAVGIDTLFKDHELLSSGTLERLVDRLAEINAADPEQDHPPPANAA
jgi:hypothetical protein